MADNTGEMLTQSAKRQIRDAVGRGVKLLDELKPKWFTRRNISIKDLQMADRGQCILGQTFNEFSTGLQELVQLAVQTKVKLPHIELEFGSLRNKLEDAVDGLELDAAYYGFDVNGFGSGGDNEEYDYLGVCWLRAIEARRAEARNN